MTGTNLVVQVEGGIAIAGFRDNQILDVVTIQQIGQELFDLVEDAGHRQLILDFGNVRFLSSQALGVLLTLRRKADQAGAKVVLAALRPELIRVFKLTNLDKMFDFYDRAAKALESFGVTPGPAGAGA